MKLSKDAVLLEALLYSLPQGLAQGEALNILECDPDRLNKLAEELKDFYKTREAPYIIEVRRSGHLLLALSKDIIRRLAPAKAKTEITGPILGTLAILAYLHYVREEIVTTARLVEVLGSRARKDLKELDKLLMIRRDQKGRAKQIRQGYRLCSKLSWAKMDFRERRRDLA